MLVWGRDPRFDSREQSQRIVRLPPRARPEIDNGRMQITSVDPVALEQMRAGWFLILGGLASGLFLGLGFHLDGFLGGYTALRRRLVRLGHIALVALGALNVLWALSAPALGTGPLAARLFLAGSLCMPLTCFLVAWRPRLRLSFALPALLLCAAVSLLAIGGRA